MSDHIEMSREDGLLVLRLTRPDKRNALTGAMYSALADAMARAEEDLSLRVVVVLGSGGSFTAGNDIADFQNEPPTDPAAPVFRFLRALAASTVPLVAGVDGDAVGIGTTMLLHCDIVLTTGRARLRLPFVDLGLVPEAGSTYLLPHIMGHARAAELLMLAQPFDGARAVELGIANRLVEPDELEAETLRVARTIAAKPPRAMRQTKQLLKADRAQVEAAIAGEIALFTNRLTSSEAREAFAAFLEKRQPDFSRGG